MEMEIYRLVGEFTSDEKFPRAGSCEAEPEMWWHHQLWAAVPMPSSGPWGKT